MTERTFTATASRSRWRLLVPALLILPAVVLIAAVIGGWGAQRIEYRVGEGRLVAGGGARWLSGERTVPLDAIVEIREVTLGKGLRTFGTGAPGVCVGEFTYDGIGPVWQATDCSRKVLMLVVRGPERPVLVSPIDRDGFRRALAEGGPAVFRPRPPPTGTSLLLRVVPGLGALLLLGFAVLTMTATRRLSFTVRDGELEVRTALFRRRFPLAGRTVRPHAAHPRVRLWGTGLPGYYTGLFRLEDGNARVYATRFDRGVLLEGRPRVFITPDDVEGCVTALRQAGAS